MHFFVILFDFIIILYYLCTKFSIMKEKTTERIPASKLLEENVKSLVNVQHVKGFRSLAQLAKAIGISAPSLTHTLKNNPSLSMIQKIANALGVSVASLFRDEKKRTVEGYAIIGGTKKFAFCSVEELEDVLAEAKRENTEDVSLQVRSF